MKKCFFKLYGFISSRPLVALKRVDSCMFDYWHLAIEVRPTESSSSFIPGTWKTRLLPTLSCFTAWGLWTMHVLAATIFQGDSVAPEIPPPLYIFTNVVHE
jgi:hypothetical protein